MRSLGTSKSLSSLRFVTVPAERRPSAAGFSGTARRAHKGQAVGHAAACIAAAAAGGRLLLLPQVLPVVVGLVLQLVGAESGDSLCSTACEVVAQRPIRVALAVPPVGRAGVPSLPSPRPQPAPRPWTVTLENAAPHRAPHRAQPRPPAYPTDT